VISAQAYESTTQEWTAECEKLGGCDFDFVPFHWYGLDAKVFAKDLVCGIELVTRYRDTRLI